MKNSRCSYLNLHFFANKLYKAQFGYKKHISGDWEKILVLVFEFAFFFVRNYRKLKRDDRKKSMFDAAWKIVDYQKKGRPWKCETHVYSLP